MGTVAGAVHVAVAVALALGGLSALGAAVRLRTRRRRAPLRDDSAMRLRAQGMISLALWELIAFVPWLVHAGSGAVLATAVIGMAPLALALVLFRRGSAKASGNDQP
jgi:hypothetical protein